MQPALGLVAGRPSLMDGPRYQTRQTMGAKEMGKTKGKEPGRGRLSQVEEQRIEAIYAVIGIEKPPRVVVSLATWVPSLLR